MSHRQPEVSGLLGAAAKFQQRVEKAVRENETGWFRLHVQVIDGRIQRAQLNTEESVFNADDKPKT